MIGRRILKGIENPRLAIYYFLGLRIARIIPDKTVLKLKYKAAFGKKLNLDHPQSFNEKLQWLKIYDRNPEYHRLVDKYEVKKYIENLLGEEYVIPLLGVYNSFEEIDFKALPDQFDLKPNHSSGDIYICKDKSKIDYAALKKLTKNWLKKDYYWLHREWQYKNIQPKLICEKYMVDESGIELKDYKLMCFDGQVKCSFVCLNRNTVTGLNVDFYDNNWELMPFEIAHYPNSGKIIARPKEFDKMVKFAEKLSQNISFVRVDFYEINGRLYFGEITFHSSSGFATIIPESYDYLLGSWINLPKMLATKE